MPTSLSAFLTESNHIEGIVGHHPEELKEARIFLDMPEIEITNLRPYLAATQPGALLRDKRGRNVTVGGHLAPAGGSNVSAKLCALLDRINQGHISPFEAYCAYEHIHPWTDGNGRTGRLVWLWIMEHRGHGGAPRGFLETFHCQALAAYDARVQHEQQRH